MTAATTFGAMVRHHRQRLALTLRAAAAEARISPGYWSQIENDKATPASAAAGSIARALGLTPATVIIAAGGRSAAEASRCSSEAIAKLMGACDE